MRDFEQYRDIEFAAPELVEKTRCQLLREHLAHCAANSPFYRQALNIFAGSLSEITPDTISQLPFTTKTDLGERNEDFLAVPTSMIVDIVLSSGTTGQPTRVMYSEQDIQRLAYNERQSFVSSGLTSDDVVLLTCTIDRCFIAGLAYFLGVRAVGAAAVRSGHGSMESHFQVIQRVNPTAIVGVPTFLRKLGLYLAENGVDPAASNVDKLICIGEPLRNNDLDFLKLGSDLESIWAAKAFSTYASSETISTFCECTAQQGGHLHPELAIVEIVNEEGQSVPEGQPGEIVVTPLVIEGMPLVRFRTGDVSFLASAPCPCGRTSLRLGPIIGRKKQMMKVRGTTLYPQAVYSALDKISGVNEYYITVTSEDRLSDQVVIHAAVSDPNLDETTLGDRLQASLRVKPGIEIELEDRVRSVVYTPKSRKPVRFIDQRES